MYSFVNSYVELYHDSCYDSGRHDHEQDLHTVSAIQYVVVDLTEELRVSLESWARSCDTLPIAIYRGVGLSGELVTNIDARNIGTGYGAYWLSNSLIAGRYTLVMTRYVDDNCDPVKLLFLLEEP